MKVLIVASGNSGKIAPFVLEQGESIRNLGIEVKYFLIKGKGFQGYVKYQLELKKNIETFRPDIIHAHFGLSGLFANIQRRLPVVTTYHGSDINNNKIRPLSILAKMLSKKNIFVSKQIAEKIILNRNYNVIPCGIDLDNFYPIEKHNARIKMNLCLDKVIILFSSSFSIKEKNYSLAKEAIDRLPLDVELIELKGYNREEVNLLLNACDAALLTSISEGSPQFIKEAMACNIPIVSTAVGDVKWLFDGIDGCFLTTFNPKDVAEKIKLALIFSEKIGRTNGRDKINRTWTRFQNNCWKNY